MKRNITIITSSTIVIVSLAVVTVASIRLQQNTSTVGTKSFAAGPTPTDPNFTEFQGILAPGFPDFPVYPDAQVSSSRKETKAVSSVNGYSAEWIVSGDNDISQIADWYSSELVNKGWVKSSGGTQDNGPTEQTLKFTKVGQSVILSIDRGGGTNPYAIHILVDIPVDKQS